MRIGALELKNRRWLVAVILAAVAGWAVVASALRWPGAMAAALALESVVLALAFYSGSQRQSLVGRAWYWVALGLASWLTADVLLALGGTVGESRDVVALLSDIFLLAGCPLMMWGLWRYPIDTKMRPARLRVVSDFLLTVGPALIIAFVLSPTSLIAAESTSLISSAIAPLFRLMLLSVAAVVFFGTSAVNLPTSLVLLLWGVNLAANGSDPAGQIIIGCSALIASGWFMEDRAAPGSSRARAIQLAQNLVPVVAVVVLLMYTALEVIIARLLPDQQIRLGLYPAILFSAMLIVRQGILLGETQLQQYAQLVNSTADAAFVCGDDGRLTIANPASYQIFSLSPNATLGNYTLVDLFEPLAPMTLPQALALARQQSWKGEGSLPRSGGKMTLSLTLDALRDESGTVKGLVGVARDVTASKKMEVELRRLNMQLIEARDRLLQLNADLEQKVIERTLTLAEANRRLEQQNAELQSLDQLKSEFVSLVSHELRAPLTNLNGGLELLLSRDEGLSLDSRETLTLMSREARRLTRFVETILDLSAFEAGQLPIMLATISLSVLVPAVMEQFHGTVHLDRLTFDVPQGLPPVLADERGLRSALFQLLDNAFKYAPESEIEISACPGNATVVLSIADHGPGIPEERRTKIFEKFHRFNTSDAQKVYGYGLGLHTTRRFVEAMGGHISFAETPGGGATFRVTLQVAYT